MRSCFAISNKKVNSRAMLIIYIYGLCYALQNQSHCFNDAEFVDDCFNLCIVTYRFELIFDIFYWLRICLNFEVLSTINFLYWQYFSSLLSLRIFFNKVKYMQSYCFPVCTLNKVLWVKGCKGLNKVTLFFASLLFVTILSRVVLSLTL